MRQSCWIGDFFVMQLILEMTVGIEICSLPDCLRRRVVEYVLRREPLNLV